MKGILFLILTICIFYVGGMYRSSMLLALAFAQGMILLLGTLQVTYCKKKLTLHFRETSGGIILGQPIGSILMENNGRFPISCFRMDLTCSYGKSIKAIKQKMFGNAECGKSEKRIEVYAPYCGIINVHVKRVVIYDYFLICSGKKRADEHVEVAVFPEETMLDLHTLYDEEKDSGEEPYRTSVLDYHAPEEISQIREFREGDRIRSIHWKLSARTDTLYVKEYEDEKKGCITLFLDVADFSKRPVGEQDAFYKVLSAFLLVFLHEGITIQVYWQNEDMQESHAEVASKAAYRGLLYRLYQESFLKRKYKHSQKEFLLDDTLGLYYRNKLLHRFDMESLEEEWKGNKWKEKNG